MPSHRKQFRKNASAFAAHPDGLPSYRSSMNCCSAEKELRGEMVKLAKVMQHFLIKEGKDATSAALAEKNGG
ncbi:hypothetical protein EBH_0026570 [Eimeria brunetti]|uniref:Uncharacterized protein n=1 Tax=Eimeria brunetti TaxID=51314 RepID=U6LAY4_9EIME|nr:hypothetical protein EBH_0026570 [Eimeria brunetti]